MAFERAALCVNDKVTAVIGRNLFFPNKPDDFHRTSAAHSRAQAVVHLLMLQLGGPGALLWLYCAELGWQLPCHPAFAMFVSNHPSLQAPGGGCQPTASIYAGAWYDWLTAFSNFHTEHHDFPDVPMWRLRELRDEAAPFYADETVAGARDGILPTLRRCFAGRQFYACSLTGVDE
jgi:fatty acid desaturase